MKARILLVTLLALSVSGFAGSRAKAREHYEKALESLRGEDYKKAAKEFRKATKDDPAWADAHFQLAMAYLALGKFKDAEKSNSRALQLDPNLEDAQYWEQFFNDRRRLAKAVESAERGHFKKAVAPLRSFLDAGGDLNRFYEVFRNSWLDALPVMEELVRELAEEKAWDPLGQTVEAASSIAPERCGNLFDTAIRAMAETGRIDPALELTDLWLERRPDAIVDVLSHRGWLLLQQGKEDEAGAVYERLERTLQSQLNLICEEVRTEFIEHFGGTFEEAELIIRTVPYYTSEAARAGVSGSLAIYGVVGVDGMLHGAELVQPGLGYGLDESALYDLQNWRFKPARINGVPLRRRVKIEVSFSAR